MFADPQSVTISGSAKTLPRTGATLTEGAFATPDSGYVLSVSHRNGRRRSSVIKLRQDTLVPNPLISGQNISQSVSVHLVVNYPAGFDVTAMKALCDGFTAYLSAGSGAQLSKLLGREV